MKMPIPEDLQTFLRPSADLPADGGALRDLRRRSRCRDGIHRGYVDRHRPKSTALPQRQLREQTVRAELSQSCVVASL